MWRIELMVFYIILQIGLKITYVKSLAISADYIFDKCSKSGSIIFPAVSGGSLYWDSSQTSSTGTYSGLMNGTNIIGCSILFKGRPQGTFGNYQQLLGLYWRSWSFDKNKNTRETQATIYMNTTLETIRSACGSSCSTGCLIIVDPVTLANSTYCNVNQLQGTDHSKYYTTDYLQLYFYMLGGLYITNSTIANNTFTTTLVSAPLMNITIDYTSFYFGKCTDTTTQYQCTSTQRCIDSSLYCDGYGAVNCGLPASGSSSADDLSGSGCTTTTSSLSAGYIALIIIGGILGGILLFLIFWWCCYRPGYLWWRCARCRNCLCTTRGCNRCCHEACTQGNGPNRCMCCRAPPRGQKHKSGGSRPATGCEACRFLMCTCCPCCNSCCGPTNDPLDDDIEGMDSYPNYDNYNGKNAYNNPNFYHSSDGWMDYINGDGFHLREAR